MIYRYVLLILAAVLLVNCKEHTRPETPRNRLSLDFGWLFIQKDITGAEKPGFDDSDWRQVDVPHDWSIEGTYDADNPSGIAGAFLPAGIGWYRKRIPIDELKADEKYFVEFDGVYMNSDVWINGHHLGNRPYGYISFCYDLTPYLKKGENVLAVRVDHSKVPSGRWYTGSGIYRHVWLTQTSDVYIPQWGTYVTTPEVSRDKAEIKFSVRLKNETGIKQPVLLKSVIKDQKGQIVAEIRQEKVFKGEHSFPERVILNGPLLWSPETPNIYTLENYVVVNGVLKDFYQTTFGVREITFRGSEGFFLNGESIKFKGVSNHQDAGPVGTAVPNDVLYRRLKMLKEMGCNALRTAHNPFSPEFYAMCDTMGFMVMNEAFDGWSNPKAKNDYGNYFADWWQQDLNDFILRDRNHPSVVIWSIGNEVHGYKQEEQKTLVDFVKRLDQTRPVTQGRGYQGKYIDLAGFNGHGEYRGVLENFHQKNPDIPVVGTEITHTLQTRGVYRTQTWYRTKDNPAPWESKEDFKNIESKVYKIENLSEEEVFPDINSKYQSSYDNSIVRIGVRDDWARVEKYDWYMGNFRWTGFDYLGESFGWPARTANFGIIDLAGFPKDHYFLYQSLWSDKPMVHLLPHWTHPGREGVKIPVVVYSNCDEAELFLNGKSLGKKEMGKERQLVWQVPYKPGILSVEAIDEGKVVAEKSCQTAGQATEIQLRPDKSVLKANRKDVVHYEVLITDENGVMVPNASDTIRFEIEGPAKLLGVENGDILDMAPHKVNYRKAFKGKCLLMLQSTDHSGKIMLTAKAKGLKPATVMLPSY